MPYPGAPENSNELIAAYEHGIDDIEAAIRGLSPEQLRAWPIAGKWSMLEVVAHLCDSDLVLSDRIKRAIAMEKPLLIGYDENAFAQNLLYHERDAAEEITLIRMTRSQVLRVLRKMPLEAWERQAVHNERGLLTTRQLVQLAVGHFIHHLPFMKEKRKALGV